MNDELPRLDAPPVASPAGAFEVVVRRARLRRRRRLSMLVAVVAIVGLAGAGLAGRGSSDEDITTAGDPEAPSTTTARVRAASTTAVDVTTTAVVDVPATTDPSVATGSATSTSTTIEGFVIDVCCPGGAPPDESPLDETRQVHAGRVVDSAGAPLTGIYVYRYDGMMAPGAETRTDLDGRFELPCGNRPLLFWGVGPSVHDGQTTPEQNWAPVVLGDHATYSPPPCAEPGVAGEDVTMVPGVTVTGLWLDGDGNPRPDMTGRFTLRVRNSTGPALGLALRSTDATGRYWLHGLPTGSLSAENNGLYDTRFEAGPGDVVYIDWGPQDDDGTIGPIIPGTPP